MTLQAGAATRDISPGLPLALYGYPHVKRISTGIHDPLLATVVVLQNGRETAVMASLDLLMVEPPFARAIREAVAGALGVREACVLIGCTHTHSAPVTSRLLAWSGDGTIPAPDPGYLDFVKSQAVAAALAAAESARPSELLWSVADASGVGGNRLRKGGVTDPECGIMALRNAQTKAVFAVSLIYGMHPTVLHEDSTLVSSDFPYYARLHLQECLGEAVTVLYHTAPCGNQSPRYYVNGQSFAEAERLGRKLGAAAVGALRGIREDDWCSAPRLGAALVPVVLPRRQLQSLPAAHALLKDYRDRYERLKAENAPRPEIRTAECAVFGAEGTVGLAEAEARGEIERILARYAPLEVQVLRVGDVNIVGLPGECFTDYALTIKQNAGTRTFVVCLVNGELQGYIVTPEALAAGGYEATNAIFAPEAGDVLVKTALAMIERMAGVNVSGID
ncbi:MAG: hypothetical protein WCL16_03635 [bacterium]